MADGGWQNQEREPDGRFGPSLEEAEGTTDNSAPGFGRAPLGTKRNVDDLAAIIETEAKGLPAGTKTAIGAVVLNRMRRGKTSSVRNVWDGFAHFQKPSPESLAVARKLLDQPETDPTGGATHFYTPQSMPKANAHPSGRGRTLESVPGVTDQLGIPAQNYRPHYADTFPERLVPGIPLKQFKFYREPGHGPTR